jgi:hypothetical protein
MAVLKSTGDHRSKDVALEIPLGEVEGALN